MNNEELKAKQPTIGSQKIGIFIATGSEALHTLYKAKWRTLILFMNKQRFSIIEDQAASDDGICHIPASALVSHPRHREFHRDAIQRIILVRWPTLLTTPALHPLNNTVHQKCKGERRIHGRVVGTA